MVGDGVHDGVGAQRQLPGPLLERLAHAGQSRMVAVPHGHDEVRTHEHHDLAGLDDLAGQQNRLVLNVIDGLEHQEQRVVVALELGPLMGVHRVLDGQRVDVENLRHRMHLVFIGFVQADPDVGLAAGLLQFPCPADRRGVGEMTRQALAVHVDRAVDHRPGDRARVASRVRAAAPVCPARGDRPCSKRRHEQSSLHRRADASVMLRGAP